jgi:fatty-acyl-CoA synthase
VSELEYNLIHRFNVGDVLRRSRARYPSKVALRYQGRELTYSQLDNLANRTARVLLEAGVRRGATVGYLGFNSPEYVAAFFGCPRLGAALVPINVQLTTDEIDYVLEKTLPQALIIDPALLSRLNLHGEPVSGIPNRFTLGQVPSPEGFHSMHDALQQVGEPPVEACVENEDVATIIFTSGTTARPKGVISNHLNWYSTLISAVADLEFSRHQRTLLALPMFHSAGLYLAFATIATGGIGIIPQNMHGEAILEAIVEHKVSRVALPATAWIGLLRVPGIKNLDFSSLDRLLVFQYLPTSVFHCWRELVPNGRWFNYWGQTETTPLGASTPPEDLARKLTNADPVGLPHLPLEVRVVDEAMDELPPGEAGELVMRGPSVTPGYLDDPEANKAMFRGGWHHSGDMGYRDEEGFLYFVDRKKDMIKTGGENVSSLEVEEVLAQDPGVAEVAVLGLPDPYWIEKVVAVIVPAAGGAVNEEAILARARKHLAAFKVPKQIFLVKELPKSSTGKIVKRALRRELAAGASHSLGDPS